jgi:DNA-binding MarR family transcriptional regulator
VVAEASILAKATFRCRAQWAAPRWARWRPFAWLVTARLGSYRVSMEAESLKSPRFDSLEQEAFLNLWRTYDRLRALEETLFNEYDLSAQQYNTLRLLRAVYPKTMPTLALGAKLISRAPDMTRLLDKLEARKLVERERRSENRRVVEVVITGAGLRLLEQLDGPVQAVAKRQLGHLGESALRHLIDLLQIARQPYEEADSVWSGS